MSRIRWLILILGPLPILGTSWTVSAWFKAEAHADLARNDVVSDGRSEIPPPDSDRASCSFPTTHPLEQACGQLAHKLEQDLGPACHILVRPPFVLAGDLSQDELERWHERTIEPAVLAMDICYFRSRPTQPITALLFRDEQSYNHFSHRLFGETGISRYGYYKPNQRTLLLDISTGDGTLLHELTHALLDFDFPDAPDWLNEGLASLHEQCRFREDARGPWIEGLVNWRLKGLQEVVRQQQLRPLAALVEDRDFRGSLEGTNYAHARYFCLYMQQKGVLEEFFRTFRANCAHDPRGLAALKQVFWHTTWQRLDEDFQRWVLELAE